jgi:hypothetical protein
MAIIQGEVQGDSDYYDIWDSAGAKGFLKSGGGGFAYEDYMFTRMKSLGLVPPGFAPAGSSNLLPDLKIRVAGPGKSTLDSRGRFNASGFASTRTQEGKVEIKLNTSADFGQSGLKWSVGRKWYLDGAGSPEAVEMRNLLNQLRVAEKVNAAWGKYGPPKKFTAAKTGRDMLQADYESDIRLFKDVIMNGADAPQTSILFNYYGSKGTHYIQIGGGYGLYYMNSDPLDLKKVGVKKFDGTLKLRVRRKPGGSSTEPWNYRFSTALLIDNNPTRSGFDLEQSAEDIQISLDPFGMFR